MKKNELSSEHALLLPLAPLLPCNRHPSNLSRRRHLLRARIRLSPRPVLPLFHKPDRPLPTRPNIIPRNATLTRQRKC